MSKFFELPTPFRWCGGAIVVASEHDDGKVQYTNVIVPTPENWDILMAFLEAWGEMFRKRGYEQGMNFATHVALEWASKTGAKVRSDAFKLPTTKD